MVTLYVQTTIVIILLILEKTLPQSQPLTMLNWATSKNKIYIVELIELVTEILDNALDKWIPIYTLHDW